MGSAHRELKIVPRRPSPTRFRDPKEHSRAGRRPYPQFGGRILDFEKAPGVAFEDKLFFMLRAVQGFDLLHCQPVSKGVSVPTMI